MDISRLNTIVMIKIIHYIIIYFHVSTPRMVNQIPNVLIKEVTPKHLVLIKNQVDVVGFLLPLICYEESN